MNDKQRTPKTSIVVKRCKSWSSSASRNMKTIGRAASSAAIRQAKATGVAVSYLKDGVIVECEP